MIRLPVKNDALRFTHTTLGGKLFEEPLASAGFVVAAAKPGLAEGLGHRERGAGTPAFFGL